MADLKEEIGNHKLGISIVVIGLLFAVLLVFNNENLMTSYTTKDIGVHSFAVDAKSFYVLNIEKEANSVLEADVKADSNINMMAEISDCQDWSNGKDKDNYVLSLNENVNGIYKVGEPSANSKQVLEIYKAEKMCLIFANTEIDKLAYVNVILKQTDKDKWRIV